MGSKEVLQKKFGIELVNGRAKRIDGDNWRKLIAAYKTQWDAHIALGVSRTWLARQTQLHGVGWPSDPTPSAKRLQGLSDIVRHATVKEARKADKARLAEAIQKIKVLETKLKAFTDIHTTKPHVVTIRKKVSHNTTEATAQVLISDVHAGEIVTSASLNYLNQYNPDICERRMIKLFQGIVRLTEIERTGVRIPVLNLFLLGDMIHGFIHPEYRQTNAMPPTKEIIFVQGLLISGIEFLLRRGGFQQINVICKTGNHGRIGERPEINTASFNSYEWVLYQVLADRFKNKHNVRFFIPEANIFYTQVYDKTIRCLHGNEIKFHGGVGGITIPLNKAIAQWDKAKHADYTFCAHWHHFMDCGNAVLNGSVVGYDLFAERIKADYEVPQQAFILIDNKHGKQDTRPIFCEAHD